MMTHDELLAYMNKEIDQAAWTTEYYPFKSLQALRAVAELHKPFHDSSGWWHCNECDHIGDFGCPTIRAIEKELG